MFIQNPLSKNIALDDGTRKDFVVFKTTIIVFGVEISDINLQLT